MCILSEFNLHIKLGLEILGKMVVKYNYIFARCRKLTQLLDDNWVSFYYIFFASAGLPFFLFGYILSIIGVRSEENATLTQKF